MATFVIACGGTGGHLAPGIAVAEELLRRGHKCRLLVSRKKVDERLSKKYRDLDFVRSPGKGMSLHPLRFFAFAGSQLKSLAFAFGLLRDRPRAVIAFGGFTSIGVVLAARMRGIPVALHEANRKPGKAVRTLSRFASRVYLPDGLTLPGIPKSLIRYHGYPVRTEIRRTNRDEARSALGIDTHGKLLVILGGSQGAASLNKWAEENLVNLCRNGVNVYCVTGQSDVPPSVREFRDIAGQICRAWFVPFCDDMGNLLSAANIAVSRAGAGAIAEAVECLLPTILVPYPYAADNHQEANARFLEQQGGCVVVSQERLGTLVAEVLDLMFSDWLLDRMVYNLRQVRRSESAALIADDLEQLDRNPGHASGMSGTPSIDPAS